MKENNTYNSNNDDNYIPSLYIPTNWNPPEAPVEVKTAITNFTKSLNNNLKSNKTLPRTNLTKLQYNSFHSIKNNNQLIVCTSNKNLGPVIMDRAEYFQRCLHEHLLCPRTYIRLTKEDALQKIRNTRCMLNQIRLNHRTKLTEAENTYFICAENLKYRIPQFYLTIKVHKQPWKTRPIVSCINSYLNVFSKWLDYRFKELIIYSPTI
jgi:hypothetical protein